MQKDNLFDSEFTFLDAVKILLLIVTAFSTWNIIDIMTPAGSFSWIRELAAVGVVEGAFIGFEWATSGAKSKRQVKFATIGFFCSLVVISFFAGMSGLLEFGGTALLEQSAGTWLTLNLNVDDLVKVTAMLTLVVWIATLASIYRFYSLNDPEQISNLARIELDESVTIEGNAALKVALGNAKPMIASARAVARIRSQYADELTAGQMTQLLVDVSNALEHSYSVKVDTSYQPPAPTAPAPSLARQALNKVMEKFTPAPIAADPEMPILAQDKTVYESETAASELHYHPTTAPISENEEPKGDSVFTAGADGSNG